MLIFCEISQFLYLAVWLEIAYLRPFWGSFGGYDGVPLRIGYRRKRLKN